MRRYWVVAILSVLTGCVFIKIPPSSKWIEITKDRVLLHEKLGCETPWVVIDAGHGGKNKGAHYSGVEEKKVVLDIALKTAEYLKRKGVFVVLTREKDTYRSLPERTWMAKAVRADMFVSIHANSAPNEQASGMEAYYAVSPPEEVIPDFNLLRESDGDIGKFSIHPVLSGELLVQPITPSEIEKSKLLAENICKKIAEKIRGVQNRGAKPADFFVLRWAGMPSVLVEVGFLSERLERNKLADKKYRAKMAEAIGEGITQTLRESRI